MPYPNHIVSFVLYVSTYTLEPSYSIAPSTIVGPAGSVEPKPDRSPRVAPPYKEKKVT